MPGYTRTDVGGYTCAGCGIFVAYGWHACFGRQSQPITDPTWPLISALQRVETELRRIADALEAKQETDS
jgi:hypothetical protein